MTINRPRSFRIRRLLLGLGVLALALISAPMHSTAAEGGGARWAILISGASGGAEYREMYFKELGDLYYILTGSLGFSRDHISVLFDDLSQKTEWIGFKSTQEELRVLCRKLAGRIQKDDLVFVFIEGHGSFDGSTYKLNLVGPDPTGQELASMLYSLPAQRFVVVNTTNCSGGSIPDFSRKGSVVVTSTKSGMEANQPQFARFYIDAMQNSAADSDKNGRVSINEAFLFAGQKVEEFYKDEGSMQTEHPVLEDNGDKEAQMHPSSENGEGLFARTLFLDSGLAPTQIAQTPEMKELAREAENIQRQVEELKYRKSGMPEAEYLKKLEELLIRLSQINTKLSK